MTSTLAKNMSAKKWFTVRCLFEHPTRRLESSTPLYEERVTIWWADDWDEAYDMAAEEAVIYADEANCTYLRLVDAFDLFDDIVGSGTEVWSNMRESNLDAQTYASTFCSTPRDRVHDFEPKNKG